MRYHVTTETEPTRVEYTTMASEGAAVLPLSALPDISLTAQRERWTDLYGTAPPVRMSRELLVQAIAYRMQERQHGGLPNGLRARLDAEAERRRPQDMAHRPIVAKDAIPSRYAHASPRWPRRSFRYMLRPGTRLLREWNGATHEVVALDDGRFSYRGTTYRSLSVIARIITGTRWSGPAFFGLNRAAKDAGCEAKDTKSG